MESEKNEIGELLKCFLIENRKKRHFVSNDSWVNALHAKYNESIKSLEKIEDMNNE